MDTRSRPLPGYLWTICHPALPGLLELSQSFSNCSKIFGSPPVNKWPRRPKHPFSLWYLTFPRDSLKLQVSLTHVPSVGPEQSLGLAGPPLVEDEGSLPSAWGNHQGSPWTTIFDRRVRAIQHSKFSLFTKLPLKLHIHCKKLTFDVYLTPYEK